MSEVQISIRVRPYDQICPLLLGDVTIPGAKATFEIHGRLETDFPKSLAAAEVSFNRYVLSYARGEGELVGIPAFILRGFRHRNFFVLADSDLRDLQSLRGKRVGTNAWSDTGTLWARAAMREAGVGVADVQWVIGPLDETSPGRGPLPDDLPLPPNAETLPAQDTLKAALQEGRIDAMTVAFAPPEVFRPDGSIRRLIQNYVEVEREYHRRTGIYPNFHIMAFHRHFADRHPELVVGFYEALRRSWEVWWTKATRFSEASPWAMADLETLAIDFQDDTPPFGHESTAHQRMLRAMCDEQHSQHLVDQPARPEDLFARFTTLQDTFGSATGRSAAGNA